MGCDTHAYHPSLRILRPYAAIDPQRRKGGGNPREILRLFLFTSTPERADTPDSPAWKLAASQKDEAKAEALCGSQRKHWVRFDPEKHEDFGPRVARGRVASGG